LHLPISYDIDINVISSLSDIYFISFYKYMNDIISDIFDMGYSTHKPSS